MRTRSAERMRLNRQRLRQGKHHIRLLVNEDEIDFLLARGYPLKRTDNLSIAEAVSAYLADSSWRAHERPRDPRIGLVTVPSVDVVAVNPWRVQSHRLDL